jgi:acetyl-CoA acyltransferase 2
MNESKFQDILVGDSSIVVTGGVDNMSQAPHAVRNIRFGVGLGAPLQLEDTLWVGLTDTYCKMPMAVTAENLAAKYNLNKQEINEFALRSQKLWKEGKNTVDYMAFFIRVKDGLCWTALNVSCMVIYLLYSQR